MSEKEFTEISLTLGLGIFGFAAKYVIKIYLATQLA